ncbi:MAG: NTF2-like N-terminal transpeptidase domain-containing protein [Mediterraneibacter faecis]
MYTMIDSDEKVYLTKEEYIQRNSKIYEGIEVSDIKISHIAVKEKKSRYSYAFV